MTADSTSGSAPGRRTHSPSEYPRDKCVHDLFDEQAETTPSKIAVTSQGKSLTYQQLRDRADQFARSLQRRGVRPDELVGICIDRSVDMLAGLLGILKAGAAYVPLDASYPRDRLAYIISDSGARLLLTQRHLASTLPTGAAELIYVEDELAGQAETPIEFNPDVSSSNLAYVIYTSGSTGMPKGVEIQHSSVVNFLCSMQREPGITADDVLLAVTTLSFDIAGLELYLPLIAGATVEIASREAASSGKELLALMAEVRPSVMQATPATWRLLLQAGWQGNRRLKILCGGEALPRDLAHQLVQRCGSLWNMYGPTETTIWSTIYRVQGTETASIPIGKPIANTQLYVLRPNQERADIAEDGDLYIGGDGLARGYHHRPELTADRFVPDPFSDEPSARMYKTGDVARYLPDGAVEFLGRIDHQVKIRGFRIECGEIEFHVNQHPTVKQSVVVALDDPTGEKQLAAYVVPSAGNLSFDALRTSLRERLPAHMVPSVFVRLESIPLTPNGKVDRLRLPAPTRENSDVSTEYVAPRDKLETELVAIWEEVLGIRPIGVRDNIFELGLHSLTAAALFVRVEKLYGEALPPGPLFQAPTVEDLAKLLREHKASRRFTSLVCIKAEGDRPPFFCIHGGAGTVYLFHELANHLEGHPVYGLQAQGLYGGDVPHRTIEEMAAHYLKEIREFYPEGPLLLGGWCFGGIVAYEIAQQARQRNQQTDVVALLAAPLKTIHLALSAPSERPGDSVELPPITSWTTRLGRHYGHITRMNVGQGLQYIRQQGREGIERRLHNLRTWFRHLLLDYPLRNKPLPERLRDTYFRETAYMAECRYVAQPYPGEVVLIKEKRDFRDAMLGWGHLVDHNHMHIYTVDQGNGDHRALMRDPAVRDMADILLRHFSVMETLAAD